MSKLGKGLEALVQIDEDDKNRRKADHNSGRILQSLSTEENPSIKISCRNWQIPFQKMVLFSQLLYEKQKMINMNSLPDNEESQLLSSQDSQKYLR